MVAVSRSLGPLHFEDLEPKRFEDLARQLLYDFKPWRQLEATGRSGSDDGFDARGYEIVEADPLPRDGDEDDGVSTGDTSGITDRLWLVQCKRERAIGPTKLLSYLKEINLADSEVLHGLVFTAACDFSKTARDKFAEQCRVLGLQEWHLWGKAELEDLLFQPKNDHLLFAYFGVSLAIRRRTVASRLRSELANKRKLSKSVALSSAEILVRDTADTSYPYSGRSGRMPGWWVYRPEGLTHRGLQVSVRWHHAFVDFEKNTWDVANLVPALHVARNPWYEPDEVDVVLSGTASQVWESLPEANKGWFRVSAVIPFSRIVAIDDLGDDVFSGMHLYVDFHSKHGPFDDQGLIRRLEGISGFNRALEVDEITRVEVFPKEVRREFRLLSLPERWDAKFLFRGAKPD